MTGFLSFGFSHLDVNLLKFVGHCLCFIHSLHELLQEVLLGFILTDIFNVSHDVTTFEFNGADCLGKFRKLWLTTLNCLHRHLQLHHHVLQVTNSVFNMRISWQYREVLWINKGICHSSILKPNHASSISDLSWLSISVTGYVVSSRECRDCIFNGILLPFVCWSNSSNLQ